MSMMGLDNTIWLVYVLAEAVLVGLLVYRRAWRILPFFFAYCIWDLLSNAGSLAMSHFLDSGYGAYITRYLIQTIIDSALQFAILVELAWSILRPIRSSLPRFTPAIIGTLILAVGAAVWPFITMPALVHLPVQIQLSAHLQETVSILRILFFLGLVACSQLLSIGWRDRELQVATGFGLYSIVSLAVTLLQTHQTTGHQYGQLNQLIVGAFICSLIYWISSFSHKQAERREFTPQMQSFLLAMAGAARANRAALAESTIAEAPFRQDR
jgi:hypothetical protein